MKLLSFKEACEYLNVTEPWMRLKIREKRIPYIKLGRLIKFQKSDLDNLIVLNKKGGENG